MEYGIVYLLTNPYYIVSTTSEKTEEKDAG